VKRKKEKKNVTNLIKYKYINVEHLFIYVYRFFDVPLPILAMIQY